MADRSVMKITVGDDQGINIADIKIVSDTRSTASPVKGELAVINGQRTCAGIAAV